jgi:hypothetical protein
MYGKVNKPGTFQTAQMISSKKDFLSLNSECTTRKMTPEDWEKYGPLNTGEIKEMHEKIGLSIHPFQGVNKPKKKKYYPAV